MPGIINVLNRAVSLDTAPKFEAFTGVRLWYDDNQYFFAGDETGRVLEVDNPWATQAMADKVLASVSGYTYQPFEAGSAILDPAAELGDGVNVGGVYGPLASVTTRFDSMCSADIAAPADEEIDHEYPYLSPVEREYKRNKARTYSLISKTADEIRLEVHKLQTNTELALEGMKKSFGEDLSDLSGTFTETLKQYSTITQTTEKIELAISTSQEYTNTKTGEIVASLSKYSTIEQTDSKISMSVSTSQQYTDQKTGAITETLKSYSTIEQTSQSIELAVSSLIDGDDASSLISQAMDKIELSVSNGEASSTITLLADGVELSSQKIKFTGDVVFASDLEDGTTVISGDCITTGAISAEFLKLGGEMYIYDSLDADALEVGYFGYLEGRISGSKFVGCGLMSMVDTAVLASEEDDVLIAAADDIGLYAEGWVRIGSEYLIPVNDAHTYCGSYSYWWYDGYFDTLHVGGAPIESSDGRLKENINYDLSPYLALFDQLKPCSYKFIKGQRTHLGMIAQEVESAAVGSGIDLAQFAAVCIDTEHDVYGLRYEEFVPLLIAKVQRLDAELKALKYT